MSSSVRLSVVCLSSVCNVRAPYSEAGTDLPTPDGWKYWDGLTTTPDHQAELALGGWLVIYRNKCLAPEIEPGHGRPSQY